jgi:hypothetical protein
MKHSSFPWLPLEAALQFLTLKIIFDCEFKKKKGKSPSVPTYKLSIEVYLNKIFSVFQEIMISQISDRAIFVLVGSYAADIDS